jgi:hypothetical protein
MNTTSRPRGGNIARIVAPAAFAAALLGGCLPGPWDYTPTSKPYFQGVTMSAYAVAGRPAQDVCFERLLSLTEASSDARSWFDSASVEISGVFSNGAQTPLTLQPKPGAVNCFAGSPAALFVRGRSYNITARLAWDSAGIPTVSTLTATARIPAAFSVRDTAYAPAFALTGVGAGPLDPSGFRPVPYRNGDTVFYMPSKKFMELNLSELPHYFGTHYGPDVKAVLITRLFDTTESRPVNSFDTIAGIVPTLSHFYQPGNLNRLAYFPTGPIPGGRNLLDSMGIYSALFWTGRNRVYFYGVEAIYADYLSALEESEGNAKIRLPTNVAGGQGFFAGMVVDSFDVHIKLDGYTQAFPYRLARVAACREKGWYDNRDCIGFYREFCRDTLWSVPTCKREAIYTSIDTVERAALPPAIRDSVEVWLNGRWDSLPQLRIPADTLLRREMTARYCIDHNYPANVAACAAVKHECDTGTVGNGCHLILWTRCQIDYWKMPACGEGIKSYCSARKDVAKILCRGVEPYNE